MFLTDLSEPHPRANGVALLPHHPAIHCIQQGYSCNHLMFATVQPTEHGKSLLLVLRFSQNLSIDYHNRVRADNNPTALAACYRQSLLTSQSFRYLVGRMSIWRHFIDISRVHPERNTQQCHQLPPAR